MNEATNIVIWIAVCCIVAVVVFLIARLTGKRGADSDCDRARDLNERAGESNRSLEEKERRARELIEESRAEIKRAGELIQEQNDDYRRAEENTRRAKELIGKAKDILARDN